MQKWLLNILLFTFSAFLIHAQEIHFSQITNHQLLINPAYTGHFNGDFRIGTGYRSQGESLSVPYKTFSAWGDYRHEFAKSESSAIGLGLYLYNDNAGEGNLQTASGYLSASFIKGFNADNSFRAALGFSVGVINRTINMPGLVFDTQWNGTIFDPNIANGEPFTGNSLFAPDFNFGGLICWEINENLYTSIGSALYHINKPKLTFYEAENRLEPRLVIHALVKNRINDQLQINPGFYYSAQQGVDVVLFGANLLIIEHDLKFLTGLWYRYERDIIPHLGVIVRDFLIEFSYDVNVSKMHIASNYRGGFEISLVKIFSTKQPGYRCSEF